MILKSLLLLILIFSQPLLAQTNPNADTAKDSVPSTTGHIDDPLPTETNPDADTAQDKQYTNPYEKIIIETGTNPDVDTAQDSIPLTTNHVDDPLPAETNTDVHTTKDSILVKPHPNNGSFFIKTKRHFFTLTQRHIWRLIFYGGLHDLLRGLTNSLHNIRVVDEAPHVRNLAGNENLTIYPFKLSFNTLHRRSETEKSIECTFHIRIPDSSSTLKSEIRIEYCEDTRWGTEIPIEPLELFFHDNPITPKTLGIKMFLYASSDNPTEDNNEDEIPTEEPSTEDEGPTKPSNEDENHENSNSIVLKVGDNHFLTLTNDQVRQIFYNNGITQIDSVSDLEAIDSNQHTDTYFRYTLSFNGHFVENAPDTTDHRIQCDLAVNLSDKRITLKDCINSELQVIEEFSNSSRSRHSSTFEELGIPKHTPRTEIN